jgi:hypothetical protein
MRRLSNILAGISLFFLILVLLLWVRSNWRYEGILHYVEGPLVTVKAAANGKVAEEQFAGKSSGWISFPGQLTYLSVTNPVRSNDWDGWSEPVDVEESKATWSMKIAAQAGIHRGLRMGPTQTQGDLRDNMMGFSWQVPYWYLTIPYWMLAIALAILPYRWVADYRWRAKRVKQGLCVKCGHHVRGVIGDCPKCGTPIPEKKA